MRVYAIAVIAVLLVFGAAANFGGGLRSRNPHDEHWLERALPTVVGPFTMRPSEANPLQSYRMDDESYKQLEPLGAVCRVFESGASAIDMVFIAANHGMGIHDPRWCFLAQGYTILEERSQNVQTRTRGVVPVMILKVQREGSQSSLALFCLKGPSGFTTDHGEMRRSMLWTALRTGMQQEAYFLRLIALTPDVSPERLAQFAAEFLDATAAIGRGAI